MMSYDPTTAFVLLSDKDDALLIDVALCLDRAADIWVQDNFCSIQVIGHLEKASASDHKYWKVCNLSDYRYRL